MIQQLLANNDIAGIFTLLRDRNNDLLVHDGLMEHATDLEQYFIIKAFKEVALERYLSFAQSSKSSQYGSKAIFIKVLDTYYNVPPYYLEYCHEVSKGIPGLQQYVDIACSIFEE